MNGGAIVSCGKAKLIYSNRLCCYDDRQIDFRIRPDAKAKEDLKIRFVFENDGNEKPLIKTTADAETGVIFELINFKSPLGTGLKKPLVIARLNGDAISILFNVYKYDGSNPTLDISLYLEKKHGK